ncbi:hypothetical protein H0E87_028239 [Populus deltoides]|uniref:Uncharacterized protein n=1 Tax=Populus deltoides TaxID=3696 RepID=A0A8T2WT94_POPDE|nr:hypothetical protein H0E87_028239 [Populus deltoides]
MLPFMAHGHLIPFLALARQIHQATGFKISIASTPLNIQYLSSTFNSSSPMNQKMTISTSLSYLFCSTDNGLPPNTENSENLSLDSIGKLLSASLSLRKPFHSLVSDIAAKQGGAYGTLAYSSLWLNLPHRGRSDSDEFHLPGFPDSCRFHINQLHHFLRNADGTVSWSKFFQPQISLSMQSFGWLCNTAEEFEPAGLEWLRNFVKLPVCAIGPLVPPIVLKNDYSSLSVAASGISTRRAEEMGVSVELTRGVQSSIDWKEVKKVIELVMDMKGKGGDMRSKAMVIKEQLRASVRDEGEDKGSSVKALDDLIKTLQSKWEMINSIS